MIPTIDRLPNGFPAGLDKTEEQSARDRAKVAGLAVVLALTILFVIGAILLRGCIEPRLASAANVYDDYKSQIIEMEHISENLTKAFPFLDILDEIIDWTSGIKIIKVKDKRNQSTYEAMRIHWDNWQWRFGFLIDGKYWFTNDHPDNPKFRKDENGKTHYR